MNHRRFNALIQKPFGAFVLFAAHTRPRHSTSNTTAVTPPYDCTPTHTSEPIHHTALCIHRPNNTLVHTCEQPRISLGMQIPTAIRARVRQSLPCIRAISGDRSSGLFTRVNQLLSGRIDTRGWLLLWNIFFVALFIRVNNAMES